MAAKPAPTTARLVSTLGGRRALRSHVGSTDELRERLRRGLPCDIPVAQPCGFLIPAPGFVAADLQVCRGEDRPTWRSAGTTGGPHRLVRVSGGVGDRFGEPDPRYRTINPARKMFSRTALLSTAVKVFGIKKE